MLITIVKSFKHYLYEILSEKLYQKKKKGIQRIYYPLSLIAFE